MNDDGNWDEWKFEQAESGTSVSYWIPRYSVLFLREGTVSNRLLQLWWVFFTASRSDLEVLSIDIDLTDVSFGEDWVHCYEPSP